MLSSYINARYPTRASRQAPAMLPPDAVAYSLPVQDPKMSLATYERRTSDATPLATSLSHHANQVPHSTLAQSIRQADSPAMATLPRLQAGARAASTTHAPPATRRSRSAINDLRYIAALMHAYAYDVARAGGAEETTSLMDAILAGHLVAEAEHKQRGAGVFGFAGGHRDRGVRFRRRASDPRGVRFRRPLSPIPPDVWGVRP